MDIFSAAVDAFQILTDPSRLVWLVIGVGVGTTVAVLPGLGGLTGMGLMMAFVYGMDPYSGIAMLVGIAAVTQTGDTFSSVMLGVPGSAGSQATIMDGYPMARAGKAGQALGAAFTVSLAGGLFGALSLLLVIPIARPIVLSLGSPELFMLAMFGISMVGVLSLGSAFRGLMVAFGGALLSTVGLAPTILNYRFTFGQLYLNDGISLVILALGLFAIPEMMDLLTHNESIAEEERFNTWGMMKEGVREAYRNRWLVLRSSFMGTAIGIVPGVGGSVIDWIVYGVTKQTTKDNQDFGKGDIRGVIGPESANNAKEGGALIPTLLFGIPGSGGTAMILGGLVLLGVQVGPRMVQTHEGVTFILVVVWTLVLANVLATSVCFGLTRFLVRITTVPGKALVPFLTVIISVAAYQSGRHPMDFVMLTLLGGMGWIMKQAGWPRAPLLIGFVLGTSAERYLSISVSRFGWSWLMRPGVLVLASMIAASVIFGSIASNRAREQVGI